MSEASDSFRGGVIRVYDRFNETVQGDTASFHFGGAFATEALSEKLSGLQVGESCHVIDLCCGWGGASQYIAERFGCRVTGIDINARSVARARALAQGAPAERLVSFLRADALDLPFGPAAVDVIWSQDGFCHIPSRSRLLHECCRVLRPAGHLVFTDFLEGEYLSSKELEVLSAAWFFPSLETDDSYRSLLEEAGFEVVSSENVGREYVVDGEVRGMKDGNPTFLQEIAQASYEARNQVELHGKEHYVASLELDTMALYMAQGKMRIGRFAVVHRRERHLQTGAQGEGGRFDRLSARAGGGAVGLGRGGVGAWGGAKRGKGGGHVPTLRTGGSD